MIVFDYATIHKFFGRFVHVKKIIKVHNPYSLFTNWQFMWGIVLYLFITEFNINQALAFFMWVGYAMSYIATIEIKGDQVEVDWLNPYKAGKLSKFITKTE